MPLLITVNSQPVALLADSAGTVTPLANNVSGGGEPIVCYDLMSLLADVFEEDATWLASCTSDAGLTPDQMSVVQSLITS